MAINLPDGLKNGKPHQRTGWHAGTLPDEPGEWYIGHLTPSRPVLPQLSVFACGKGGRQPQLEQTITTQLRKINLTFFRSSRVFLPPL